jgi:hypothetical protein
MYLVPKLLLGDPYGCQALLGKRMSPPELSILKQSGALKPTWFPSRSLGTRISLPDYFLQARDYVIT